jgi:hypothetical protein
MIDERIAEQITLGQTLASDQPVNKHGSVTQVKNGFIFYAGGETFIAYTFIELTEFLKEYFV